MRHPSSKVRALDLLMALGMQLSDEVKLDRIVPYVMTLIEDEDGIVRLSALLMLTELVIDCKDTTCDQPCGILSIKKLSSFSLNPLKVLLFLTQTSSPSTLYPI